MKRITICRLLMSLFGIPGLLLSACGDAYRDPPGAGLPTEGLTLEWSPDGQWLLFPIGQMAGVPELYALAVDDSKEEPAGSGEWVHLSQGFSNVIEPDSLGVMAYSKLAWSPDGSRIAFNAGGTVYAFDASCLEQPAACVASLVPLAGDASAWLSLQWSPDSTMLLVESTIAGPTVKTEKGILADDFQYVMRVVPADGSQQAILRRETPPRQAPDWEEHPPFSPAWSPDGERIVYCSGDNGESDLYLLTLAGEKVDRLTNTHGIHEYSPGWSPDGGEILYAADSGGQHDIYRQSLDGGAPACVTCDVRPAWDYSLLWPDWSPDGGRIAYGISGRPALFKRAVPIYLYVIAPDGSGQVPVVEKGFPGPLFWSPDGTRLAFAFRPRSPLESQESYLLVINADGSGLRRLTE